MKTKKKETKTIIEQLNEFNSLERWEKTTTFPHKDTKEKFDNIHRRDFLIKKYVANYPDDLIQQDREEVIRL